jgi:hypothetical protein
MWRVAGPQLMLSLICALLLCTWLPLAAYSAPQPAGPLDPVQAHVDAVHAQSAALRRQLLTAWTFEPDATPSPGYYSSFAGAPIQHIIAAMSLNENATAVALAQTALANPNMSSHFKSVYEWTCVARAFAMFNSKSSWENAATMHSSTEESMKNMSFQYATKNTGADKFCAGVPPSKGGGSMCTSGSENLDYDAKSSGYIALLELSKFPEYVPPPCHSTLSPDLLGRSQLESSVNNDATLAARYKDRPLGVTPPPAPPGPSHLPRCNKCCKAGCGLKCCSAEPPPAPQKCCCLARVKNESHCPAVPPPPPSN